MIEKVNWDSDFFRYPVGSLEVTSNSLEDISHENLNRQDYRLLYIYSKSELSGYAHFNMVDKKITYKKKLCVDQGKKSLVEFDDNKHKYTELLELAYLSGKFSRFRTDKNFKNDEFSRLYKTWLDRSLAKDIAFKVLVSLEDDVITGFVTLKEKNKKCSQIGLIAVNNNFQGKRIGTKLIKECEIWSIENGYSELEVVTQFENKAARGLYEKNGFEVYNELYIYHYWNNQQDLSTQGS